MNAKTLLILGAVTAAAVVGTMLTGSGEDKGVQGAERGPLFPELSDRVNDVARVTLRSGEENLDLTLQGGDWVLSDRGGYPAKFEEAKETVLQVANLVIDEVKTADPARFEQLGVQDAGPDSSSREVTLYDAAGAKLASVIVGNAPARNRDGAFVRRAGEDQSFQTDGTVGATTRLADWVDTDLMKIAADRVDAVEIVHADGERLGIVRDALDPAGTPLVQDVPEGRELSFATAANSIVGALASLQFEDVRPAGERPEPAEGTEPTRATFRCKNGLVLAIELVEVDDTWWATFAPSFDESAPRKPLPPNPIEAEEPEEGAEAGDDATDPAAEAQAAYEAELAVYEAQLEAGRAEANELGERLAPWAYALQSYRVTNMTKRMEDLLKPLPDPEAEAEGPAAASTDGAPDLGDVDLQKLLQEAGIDPEQLLQDAPVEAPTGGDDG